VQSWRGSIEIRVPMPDGRNPTVSKTMIKKGRINGEPKDQEQQFWEFL